MNIRYITVNRKRFKIERYKNDSSDDYIYHVLKYDPHPYFDPYTYIFKCNLSTLKENLIRYTLEQTLL